MSQPQDHYLRVGRPEVLGNSWDQPSVSGGGVCRSSSMLQWKSSGVSSTFSLGSGDYR